MGSIVSYYKKPSLIWDNFYHTFFFLLPFKSFAHLKYILEQDVGHTSTSNLLFFQMATRLSQHHLLNALFSALTWSAAWEILRQTFNSVSLGWCNSAFSCETSPGWQRPQTPHWELQTSQTCNMLKVHTHAYIMLPNCSLKCCEHVLLMHLVPPPRN